MKRFRILIPILLVLLVTAYTPRAVARRAEPPSALKNAADLQITAERQVNDIEVYSISPDGSLFFTVTGGKICTGAMQTFQVGNCIAVGDSTYIDRASVAWSPDNSRIAFTETPADNSVHSMDSSIHSIAYPSIAYQNQSHADSDIWVLDLKTGKLSDLTSEVGEGVPIGSALDTQPAWSPDGKKLAFVRSDENQKGSTSLYTISAQGGKPHKLLTVNDQGIYSVIGKLYWTGDGSRIVYAVKIGISALYPQDGIWIVDRDGKHARQLAGNSPHWYTPVLLDVSAKGGIALIDYYWGYWSEDWTPNDCYVYLLDLHSGALTPLKQPAGTSREFYSPMDALFSPDGSKVLYFYIQIEKAERRLAVLDVKGGAEALLSTPQWLLSSDFWHTYRTLIWAGNDTIYAATDFTEGWLLTVGSK